MVIMSDSPVIAFLNKATDLILLNLIWILCCLPVFTAGAATVAAYYVSITSIRCGDGYVVKRFFTSFKRNFAQITPVWLGIFLAGFILTVDMLYWYRLESGFGKVMFKTGALLKNAAAFAIGYLPYTAIILVITGVAVYANLVSLVANGIMLFIGFALLIYVQSFFFYRVFMNHIDERYDDFDNPEET